MRSIAMVIKQAVSNSLKQHALPILLLVASTAVVYGQSLGHEFLTDWDDNLYVTANDAVRGFTYAHLKAAFSTFYAGNYAPAQIISYMLDYSLWGMRAAGFILTNILLHILNGILYYTLLIRTTGRKAWAFLAATIFLLHPIQVESVAWISQRKNLLAMFFFLVSFLLYIAYRDSGPGNRDAMPETQNSKPKIHNSRFIYLGSIATFVLALLAKAVAIILPAVLLLHDFCHDGKAACRKHLVDKIPYIAACVIILLVTLKSQTPELGGGKVGYHGGSPLATFLTMLPVFVRYLRILFWPSNLSAVYAPPVKTGIDGIIILSALLLAALCVGGIYLYRRRSDLFFWGALFFIGLLPVSQIVPLVTLMNDRYLYFPMVGGAAFVVGVAVAGFDALAGRSRKIAVTFVCLLLLSLPALSFKRVQVWQNSLTLWTDAVEKDPSNTLACLALAVGYHRYGKLDTAGIFYERALSLDPSSPEVLQNIGVYYQITGNYEKAGAALLKLTRDYPQLPQGFVLLGDYLFRIGDIKGAADAYQRGLLLNPGFSRALDGLERVRLRYKGTVPGKNGF